MSAFYRLLGVQVNSGQYEIPQAISEVYHPSKTGCNILRLRDTDPVEFEGVPHSQNRNRNDNENSDSKNQPAEICDTTEDKFATFDGPPIPYD